MTFDKLHIKFSLFLQKDENSLPLLPVLSQYLNCEKFLLHKQDKTSDSKNYRKLPKKIFLLNRANI